MYAQKAIVHNAHCAYRFKVQSCDCINFVRAIEGTVKHIYFVAETKASMNSMQLRLIVESKIHCAREHFKAISNGEVVYDVVDSYQKQSKR